MVQASEQKRTASITRPWCSYSEQKSILNGVNFWNRYHRCEKIKIHFNWWWWKVGFQLREQKKLASCITVKIRYSNFDTETKQIHIPYTSSDYVILKVVQELFDKLYNRKDADSFVGVRLSNLFMAIIKISLFDDTEEDINLYEEMDFIKHKIRCW